METESEAEAAITENEAAAATDATADEIGTDVAPGTKIVAASVQMIGQGAEEADHAHEDATVGTAGTAPVATVRALAADDGKK